MVGVDWWYLVLAISNVIWVVAVGVDIFLYTKLARLRKENIRLTRKLFENIRYEYR